MLQLKRIELQGFKSFCDRQEMRFHGNGIAAVVGPNGCGKSNLSDAISWVLGEQSARSLRGSRMEDVIFAGTRDRKPVGMASVTMTMVEPALHSDSPGNGTGNGNGNGHAKSHAGEVTITRRLYRSGESEYLINGHTARLRDIQDIFMGSGLGPESYAIIEQGRIGQILSTRPQDRRAVLEEAAGISRFRTKKRLSEVRLESAKGNLTRVFDILEEVGRQLNSLKRQATKAKRFTELRTEMIGQLRVALTGRFQLLEREAAKAALELNAATQEFRTLSAEVEGKEKAASAILERSYALEAQLTELRRHLAEQRVDAERVKGRLEAQGREISSIAQRLGRGETESVELEKRFAQQQLDLRDYTARVEELEQKAQTSRRALQTKTEERDRAQNSLRERERALETARQQVLRLLGEASGLKNQLGQIEQFLAGLQRDAERLSRDEHAATADQERLKVAKVELAAQITARQAGVQRTVEQRREVESLLAALRVQSGEGRRKLEELRGEASRLRARRDSLNDIIRHRSYTTQSVKRLFTAAEKGQAQFRPIGVLADFLEADPQFEKAAEEFLHEELEFVLVPDWTEAERALAFVKADADGRATFLVQPPADSSGQQPEDQMPEGILARLRDVVRMHGPLADAGTDFLPRLSRCFLVPDHATAQRLASEFPALYFLLPDGICYQNFSVTGGKKSGSGPLGLKRELRELSAKYTEKQREFEETSSILEQLEAETAKRTAELDELRAQQNRQEKDGVGLDAEMRKVNDDLSRSASKLQVAKTELARLTQERLKGEERRDSAQRVVLEKEAARVAQEEALAEARSSLEGLQREAARLGEEHSALRVEQAGLDERHRSDSAAKRRIGDEIQEMANRKQNLAREMERLGIEKSRLLADNLELDGRASTLAE
ncbi:MAG: AAA family ATPase, partial [Bryobacteraceae bacterium]|nr:AAA family ATPase [Bryobacteraceae bacterium]